MQPLIKGAISIKTPLKMMISISNSKRKSFKRSRKKILSLSRMDQSMKIQILCLHRMPKKKRHKLSLDLIMPEKLQLPWQLKGSWQIKNHSGAISHKMQHIQAIARLSQKGRAI